MKLDRGALPVLCVLLAACGVDAVGTPVTTDTHPATPAPTTPAPAPSGPGAPAPTPSPTEPVACTDGALDFEGTGQIATVPDSPALDLDGDFTVEAWVLPTSTASGVEMVILSHHDAVASQGWALRLQDGRFEIGVWGTEPGRIGYIAGNAGDPYVTAGKWMFVTGTLAGDTLRIYADGKLRDTQKLGLLFGRDKYRGSLAFGRAAYSAVAPFAGKIAEVRLSKTARFTTETFQRPNAPFASDPTTVALFPLDEPSGATISDTSGGGHNGLLADATQQPKRTPAPCVTTR